MVESNTVTVTYSVEVPPVTPPPTVEKIKCPFCDLTFDSYDDLMTHIWEAHKEVLAVTVIAIFVIILLIYYASRK